MSYLTPMPMIATSPEHVFEVVYRHTLPRFWRREFYVVCWHCDLVEGLFPNLAAAHHRREQKERFPPTSRLAPGGVDYDDPCFGRRHGNS